MTLGSLTVNYSVRYKWYVALIEFNPTVDITTFAIGAACYKPTEVSWNKYLVDHLILTDSEDC